MTQTYKPQVNSKQPFARPTGYRPVVTNYRNDYSSIRNNNWISAYQHRASHPPKTDDTTAKIMTGIFVAIGVLALIAIAL